VFGAFCGLFFYRRHKLANSLIPANQAAITRGAICPTGRKMEPQITQNTQKAAMPIQAPDDAFDSGRGFAPTRFIDVLKNSAIHLRVRRVLRFDFLYRRHQLARFVDASKSGRDHPRRDLSDRQENGTANHAKHAKGAGASQVQDNAFDLKARRAEVE
jgi:hypothetical protein